MITCCKRLPAPLPGSAFPCSVRHRACRVEHIFSFTHIFYGFSPAGYIRQLQKRGRISGSYFTDLKTLFSIRSNNLKIFMESVNVQCAKLVVATCHAVDSKCFDVIYVSSGCSSLKENVTSHISWKGNLSKAKPSPKGE